MKKRIVAILLVFTLAMSGNTMAWAAPEGEIVGDDVSGEGGNIEKAEEIGDDLEVTENTKEDGSDESFI